MKNGRYRDVDQTFWFKNDKLHREDGPAMEGDDGACVWYLEERDIVKMACNDLAWWGKGMVDQWAGAH